MLVLVLLNLYASRLTFAESARGIFDCRGVMGPGHDIRVRGRYVRDEDRLINEGEVQVTDEHEDVAVNIEARDIVLCLSGKTLEIKSKTGCELLAQNTRPGLDLYVRVTDGAPGDGEMSVILPPHTVGRRYAKKTGLATCGFRTDP